MIKTYLLWGVLGLGTLICTAQERTLASGGQATGTSGSLHYSLGQVVDIETTAATGTLSQGIQLGFDVFTLSHFEFEAVNLRIQSYPNPTQNDIIITVNKAWINTLNFELYDLQSKQLQTGNLSQSHTKIGLQSYPTGIYILKVTQKQNLIKTFKIIKH